MACAIVETTSGSEPWCETTAPKVFEASYSAQLLPLYLDLLLDAIGAG